MAWGSRREGAAHGCWLRPDATVASQERRPADPAGPGTRRVGQVMPQECGLRQRLLGSIATMDAQALHTQGNELFRGCPELFKMALLHAMGYAGGAELRRWEHVLGSCSDGEKEQEDTSTHVVQTATVVAHAVPVATVEVVASAVRHNARNRSRGGCVGKTAAGVASTSAAAAAAAAVANSVSQGQWLALQQELRMKDFVVWQLERQLGFERGCDEWLVAECWREEQEDESDGNTPNSFASQSACWWRLEAQCVRSLYDRVDLQSTTDQSRLTVQDRADYFAHLQPLVDQVVRAFNVRRVEAERTTERRLRELKRHRDNVSHRKDCGVVPVASCSGTAPFSDDGLPHEVGEDGEVGDDEEGWEEQQLDESPETPAAEFGNEDFEFPDEEEDSDSLTGSLASRATAAPLSEIMLLSEEEGEM